MGKTTIAEANTKRKFARRFDDFVAELNLSDEQSEKLQRILKHYINSVIRLEEKKFEIELAQLIKSMNRLID